MSNQNENQSNERNQNEKTINDFLKNPEMIKRAEENAIKIASILSNGNIQDLNPDKVFTVKQLVQKTTLSWRKAAQLLSFLTAFGYIKQVDKLSFSFCLSCEFRCGILHDSIMYQIHQINSDISVYEKLIKEDKTKDMEDSKKDDFDIANCEEVLKLKDEIINTLTF